MKAIVCGAGQVGYGIARALAQEGNAVTIVDWSTELVDKVVTDLDVRGVVGHGSHPDVLERAGAGEADLIVAVTHYDETNMIACQVAHSLFDTPMKIARVRSQNYLDPAWADLFTTGNLPIDVVISPELEVGRAILQRVETPGAFNTAVFSGGRVQLLGIRLDEASPVAGSTTDQLMELFPDLRVAVVGVQREQTLFIPERTDPLLAGDDVYVVAESVHASRVLDIFGRNAEKIRRVVIVGAGNIGVYVAKALERAGGVKTRLVEANKKRAEQAADILKKTVVLHGDGLDTRLMQEAGAPEAELVVCVTNDDKVNMLSAVMAKREGAQRALSLVNERTFEGLRDPWASMYSSIRAPRRSPPFFNISAEAGSPVCRRWVVARPRPLKVLPWQHHRWLARRSRSWNCQMESRSALSCAATRSSCPAMRAGSARMIVSSCSATRR